MIYQCNQCHRSTFETYCSRCGASEPTTQPQHTQQGMTPLDPSFYPDFQYQSKGFLKDIWGKKKEQAQLNDLLNSVLRKYAELKQPYFTNFIHTTRNPVGGGVDEAAVPGARMDGIYTERELFREVLIRRGFDELEQLPTLLGSVRKVLSQAPHSAGQ